MKSLNFNFRHHHHYHVAPRYTPGSPATVPETLALRIAEEETHAYKATLEGVYGEPARVKASADGCGGIVELRQEKPGGWLVKDVITGRVFFRTYVSPGKLLPGDVIKGVRTYDQFPYVLPLTVKYVEFSRKGGDPLTVVIAENGARVIFGYTVRELCVERNLPQP